MTKFLGILLMLCAVTHGYKILGLFPHPAISHFQFFQPIMRALAEAGHNVTVVGHFPDKNPHPNYRDLVIPSTETLMNTVDLKGFIKSQTFYSHFSDFFMLYQWSIDHCNATLNSGALQTVLEERYTQKYDVIITEQFNSDCMMGVAHVISPETPVIALSSCAIMPWYYDRFSIPMNPAHNPVLFFGQSEKMNFLERLGNWITHYSFKAMYKYYSTPAADSLIKLKFGHNLPSTGDLGKQTSLLMVNQHFSLMGAQALSPQVIELGGIHIQKAKPLDPELQRFLDSADNGIVYISWGSMIKAETLPHDKREGILSAIRRLKQKVIWKFENDTLANKPDNLLISKWLPQRDILCHPNVKAFMTHGGLMGTSEAVYCGVPTVVTPIYGDQFLNANAMKNREMGVILRFDEINENSVFRSLSTVLEKSYQDSAKKVSYSYNHRPKKALESAVWWVEYIAKTEGGHLLRSHGAQLSAFEYYCLDIYLFWTILVLFIVILGKVSLKKMFAKREVTTKVKIN